MIETWDPLRLSPKLNEYLGNARPSVAANGSRLDAHLCASVLGAAQAQFEQALPDLLSDDSLPELAHTFLAVGHLPRARRLVLARIGDFAQSYDGERAVRQRDPEGDFHPWQSFAYMVLVESTAGSWEIPPDGTTLREIARASTDLRVDRGEELGHPLLAASLLFSADDVPAFTFDGARRGTEELLCAAIGAQWVGDFEVCRKFHLTSGIASVVSRYASLRRYRSVATMAVAGQLRVLEAVAVLSRGLADSKGTATLQHLRRALGLSDLFQDHLFYAGHLLEFHNICHASGYDTLPDHYVVSLINDVNLWLSDCLASNRSPHQYRVQLPHYLRALATYLETLGLVVDHESVPSIERHGVPEDFPFRVAEVESRGHPRPPFLEAVLAFEKGMPDLPLRGTFAHFRRTRPESWPRSLHYELLDYGDWLGAELHIEGDDGLWACPFLSGLANVMPAPPGSVGVEYDPDWWGNRGRLRVLYAPGTEARTVAAGLAALVDATEPTLSRIWSAQQKSGQYLREA